MSEESEPFGRDKQWLSDQGYIHLDPDEFSGRVCRVWADGVSESDARSFVLKKMLKNIEDLDPEFSKLINENYWDLI